MKISEHKKNYIICDSKFIGNHEEDFNQYIEDIKKKSKKYYIHDDELICRNETYKVKDNKYQLIKYTRDSVSDYKDIDNIDTDGKDNSNEILDEFCEQTKKFKFGKDSYEKIMNGNICNSAEYKASLEYIGKYILKMRTIVLIDGLRIIPTLIPIAPITWFIRCLINVTGGSEIVVSLLTSLTAIFMTTIQPLLSENHNFDYTSGFEFFSDIGRLRKLRKTRREVKRVLKKGGMVNITVKTEVAEEENKTEKKEKLHYQDAVMQQFDDAVKHALNLDDANRKVVLKKIRLLINEYTEKSIKLAEKKTSGLKLDDEEHQLMAETVDKIVIVESEINRIMNNNARNKAILYDSMQLVDEIDKNLAAVEGKQVRKGK